MNKELLESQWTQIREILREKFSNLSDEDIRQISGRYDQLVSKLQQKYGYSREEAEDRIKSWNFDRFTNAPKASTTRHDTYDVKSEVRKEEGSSFFKWLLALGIPILLLGALFLNSNRNEITNTPVVTTPQTTAETPIDRALSSNLRNTLFTQNISGTVLENVQITARNGVVTLSGTVPSNEIRNSIVRTTEDFAGVSQVINNLIIK